MLYIQFMMVFFCLIPNNLTMCFVVYCRLCVITTDERGRVYVYMIILVNEELVLDKILVFYFYYYRLSSSPVRLLARWYGG